MNAILLLGLLLSGSLAPRTTGTTTFTLDDAASAIRVEFDTNGGRLRVVQKSDGFSWSTPTSGGGDAMTIGPVTQTDATHLAVAWTHTSSGAALTLSLELDPATSDLRATLSSSAAIPNGVQFPHAFHPVGQGDDGLAILPLDLGFAVPESQTTLANKLSLLSNRRMEWFGGTDRDNGRGWLAIVETHADFELRVATGTHESANVIGAVPKWLGSNANGSQTPNLWSYDRVLRYRFVSGGGYVALAKHFRDWARTQGWWKSLVQKNGDDPQRKTDKLVGAPILYLWGDGRDDGLLDELYNAGLRKAVVQLSLNHLDQNGSFPNAAHPDGSGWLDAARAHGFLPGFYDIYAAMRVGGSAPTYDGTRYLWPTGEGLNWAYYDGGGNPDVTTVGSTTMYGICAQRQAEFAASTRIPAHMSRFGMDAYFFDTTCATPAREDYGAALGHFATRATDIENRRELLDAAYSNATKRLVTGTEQGRSWAVPMVHWGEGKFWLGETGNIALSDLGSWNDVAYPAIMTDVVDPTALSTNKLGPLLSHGWQVPLWELVFHECFVDTVHWSRPHNKFLYAWDHADRWAMLRGQAPLLNVTRSGAQGTASRVPNTLIDNAGGAWSSRWSVMSTRFARTFDSVCAWHEQVGYSEMIDHGWLTPDRGVQFSEFSLDNGVTGLGIVVNFGNYDGAFGHAGATWSGTRRGQALSVPVADYRTYSWTLPTVPPTVYCTAKVNSAGCLPELGSQGTPSASSAAAFTVQATQLLNQKSGLYFYGFASTALPFQGGVRCVAVPLHRTPIQSSGGSTSGQDCTGTLSIDMNARVQSGVDPLLVSGATFYGQFWYRDPSDPHTTGLSAALAATIGP